MTKVVVGPPSELPLSAKTQSPKSYLFTSIIKLNLGEQAAYVFATLLTYDRLNLSQLATYTKMRPSVLKKIMVSLIQLGCAVYYKETHYLTGKSQVLYYPNDTGCWKLVYAGDIISSIKREYNNDIYATIIQNVLIAGHVTIDEYLQDLTIKTQITDIERAFSGLVKEKWLIPINEIHFQNKFDIFNQIYQQKMRQFNAESAGKLTSQSKKITAVKEQTRDKYLQVLNNEELLMKLYTNASHDDAYYQRVNPKLPLTFNFDRYLRKLRTVHLSSEALHRVGEISSKIYALVLNKLESKSLSPIPSDVQLETFLANVGQTTVGLDPQLFNDLKKRLELRDQERGFNINANDIFKELKSQSGKKLKIRESDLIDTIVDPTTDITSLKRKADSEGKNPSKKVKLEMMDSLMNDEEEDDAYGNGNGLGNGINGGASMNSANDQRILTLINQHLKLLSLDTKIPFLKETNPGSYYIPFTELQPVFTRHSFKQYVKNLFGPDTLRLINCMEEKKLIDEKSISKIVLMKESQIRSILAKLQMFQIVEVQEIPKTNDRSATRSFFAFRFKYQKAVSVFKDSLIYNMAQVLENLEGGKVENKILLDKISRDDVRGNEHRFLLTSELVQLKKYYDFEKLSLAKMARLRSGVEVFEFLHGL